MVEPIKPEEVQVSKPQIPDFVIEAFNNMIKRTWDGKYAIIKQDDIVNEIMRVNEKSTSPITHCKRSDIFTYHWLEVEDIFLAAGWDVIYHKESQYEPGESYFKFAKPIATILNS